MAFNISEEKDIFGGIRLLAVMTDLAVLSSAFFIASSIRLAPFSVDVGTLGVVFSFFPFFLAIYFLSLFSFGAYQKRFKASYAIIERVLLALSVGLLVMMSFAYVFRAKWGHVPSSVFILSFFILVPSVIFFKLLLYKLTGLLGKRVVFLGAKELASLDTILSQEIDEIVLTSEALSLEQAFPLLNMAFGRKFKVSILPEAYDEMIAKKISIGKHPEILLRPYFENNPEENLIRLLDIFLAAVFLFFFWPFFIVVAMCIKLDSKGPVLYKQKRIGLDGKEFDLYKFRSMIMGAGQFSRPATLPLSQDERVTRFGRFLRRSRIDEFPQVFNVLLGDMSFVGPRPEMVERVKRHRALQGIRLSVRPGLTGLAQVEGNYHTAPKDKLRYDYLYIRNRTFLLNIKILARTVLVVLTKPGS